MPVAAEEPSAAGATIQVLRRALEDIVGVNVVASALKKLPTKVREEFDPITPMTWVPLSTSNMAVEYIAAEARRNPDDLMDEAVRKGAETMFRTSWRLLLRLTTDHALIARTPVIYSKWRNIGQLESNILSPGRSEILLRGWPGVSERNVRTLAVSIETVLRLAGRRAVRIEWTRSADGARYLAYWR
jgi:predicted AlkP superfamily phosphohydrolase/phosphomutase